MQTFCLAMLGFFLAGYLALEGADFGMGMMLPLFGRRDQPARDGVIRAIAPFFLGNEVWLVAAFGLLNGAFPRLDGSLESRLYPIFVLILIAWLTRDAGLWFRGHGGATWRARWDTTIAIASTLLAFGWGLVLGNLAQGVPEAGSARVFGLIPVLGGLALTGICALHGAATLGLRLPLPEAARVATLAKALTVPTAVAIMATGVAIALTGTPAHTWPLWLLGAVLLAGVVTVRLTGGRPPALPATSIGLLAAIPLLTLTGIPYLPTGIPLSEAASGPATLAVLTPVILAVLPVLVVAQAALWWLCRGRVDVRSWSYF
jgi:cytochrome bd-type quinol oxidase subunit 2